MNRIHLDVPYAEKDQAKRLGARWDPEVKRWYIDADHDRELFKAWLPKQSAEGFRNDTEYAVVSSGAFIVLTLAKCWKCNRQTDFICIYCTRATIDGDHYDHINCSNLTAVDDTLKARLETYPQFRLAYSQTMHSRYFANHCRWCDALQGDFFAHEEPGGAFFPLSGSDYDLFGFQPITGTVRFTADHSIGVMEDVFSERCGYTHPDTWPPM